MIRNVETSSLCLKKKFCTKKTNLNIIGSPTPHANPLELSGFNCVRGCTRDTDIRTSVCVCAHAHAHLSHFHSCAHTCFTSKVELSENTINNEQSSWQTTPTGVVRDWEGDKGRGGQVISERPFPRFCSFRFYLSIAWYSSWTQYPLHCPTTPTTLTLTRL